VLHLTLNLTLNPNVTWSGLLSNSNGFFRDPCDTFPPNFAKIDLVVVPNPVNRQTNKLTNKQTNKQTNRKLTDWLTN